MALYCAYAVSTHVKAGAFRERENQRARGPRITRRRREASRVARLHPGVAPVLVRLQQLRDLVLDHLDPGGLLHLVRSWLEQRRARRDRVGLADHFDLHPVDRLLHVGARLGVPDVGRNLLVGKQTRRRQSRLLHRLAEPHRSDRHPGVGRLRKRDVPGSHAWDVQRELAGGLQPDQDVHHVPDHPGGRRRHQHRLQPPARRHQQHLRLQALRSSSSFCGSSRHSTRASATYSPPRSTTPASSAARRPASVSCSSCCRSRQS